MLTDEPGAAKVGVNPESGRITNPRLSSRHLEDLKRSGLTDEQIRACGFYSLTDPAEIGKRLGWREPAATLGPCLAIPYPGTDGRPTNYTRFKPDTPRLTRKQRVVKYESPRGEPNRVYVPPGSRAALNDPSVPLLLTEGEKKAAAADQHGFACLGLTGVYGWQKKRKKGARGRPVGRRELIPDLASVAWRGRPVFVIFDSDAATNPKVRRAERDLVRTIRSQGAEVRVVRLPPGPGGEKVGLDDFLIARGPEALRTLLDETGNSRAGKDYGAALFRDEAELDRLAGLKLDDPAELAAERARLKKAGVSLRDLDKALAPRVDEILAERRAAAGGTREPNSPATGPYFVKDGAVHRVVLTKDGQVEIPLCNFAACITHQVTRDDGAEQTRAFTLTGRTAAGVELPPVDIPADQFAAMNWVTARWGNRPVVYAGQGTKDHLRTAIQMLSGNPPERTVYGHTGWRESGGRWVYLHAGGAIGTEGPIPGIEVDLSGPLSGFVLPDPPAGAELVAAIRASLTLIDGKLAPHRVVVPLLAAVYRAVLGGVDFALHLYGRTGVFKSELAALCQQHFGPALGRTNLPANWSSTANAVEGTAFAAKDAVLVVDDFNPTGAADPQKLHAAADRVFRGVGNGTGRNRLSPDMTIRPPRPPRALVLSTGEDIPRGHSCRARVVVVEVEPGDVGLDRLTTCQQAAATGLFARSLAGFVRWLAPQYAATRARLQAEREAARAGFGRGTIHARTPSAVGDLMVGLEYFVRFANSAGAVTDAGAEQILTRGRAALAALAGDQADHLQAGDPVEQFLRLVPAVLLSGQAHLSAPGGGHPEQPDVSGWRSEESRWVARGNRIGWADAETVYLDPDAAYAEVQRMAATQREPLTMSQRTLWKRLHERGLLAKVERRGGRIRFAARATLGGERVDVLHFHRRTLFPVGESGPSDPLGGNTDETSPTCRATPQDMGVVREGENASVWSPLTDDSGGKFPGVGHSGHSSEVPSGDVEEFVP